MKAIILTIALSLTLSITNAQTSSVNGTDITVTVPTKSTQGAIKLALYNEATFMKAAPLKGLTGKIIDGKAVVTFTNVPAGEYAISIYHDKNGNNRMDFASNGMPEEDYGTSNNNMTFGPPNWSASKFAIANENLSLEIRM